MKELSIEEKATRYDEATDKAKKELDACGSQDCDAARQIFRLFPELEESEDERIINFLIMIIDKYAGVSNEEKKKCLSLLEKQGEHANFINKIQIGDKVTRNEDGVLVNLSQLKRVAKKDEKQGGQKPAEWSEKDESTTEDLGKYINELSKQFQEVSFAKLSRIAVRVAKWQKQQMMAKAIDGKVIANGMGNPILHLWDKGRHLIGKKVKVILIKED